jgi:hypothetical protein
MTTDRRSFLKLFGASSAAVATREGVAMASDPGVQPLPRADEYFCQHYDVVSDVLYSSVSFEKNAMQDQYHLFGQPVGLGVGLSETNLRQSNRLPAPEAFCVKRIGFAFSPKTEPGLRSAICDRYTLSLTIGAKRYWSQPLAFCFSVADVDRERGFATLPDVSFVTLDLPLIFDNEIYFQMDLRGEPIRPSGKAKGWALLGGLWARGIQ